MKQSILIAILPIIYLFSVSVRNISTEIIVVEANESVRLKCDDVHCDNTSWYLNGQGVDIASVDDYQYESINDSDECCILNITSVNFTRDNGTWHCYYKPSKISGNSTLSNGTGTDEPSTEPSQTTTNVTASDENIDEPTQNSQSNGMGKYYNAPSKVPINSARESYNEMSEMVRNTTDLIVIVKPQPPQIKLNNKLMGANDIYYTPSENDKYEFDCVVKDGNPQPEINWAVEYVKGVTYNESKSSASIVDNSTKLFNTNKVLILHVDSIAMNDVNVTCISSYVRTKNSTEILTNSVTIKTVGTVIKKNDISSLKIGDNVHLVCETNLDDAAYEWKFKAKNSDMWKLYSNQSANYSFVVSEETLGAYMCHVHYSVWSHEVIIDLSGTGLGGGVIAGIVVGSVVALVIIILIAVFIYKKPCTGLRKPRSLPPTPINLQNMPGGKIDEQNTTQTDSDDRTNPRYAPSPSRRNRNSYVPNPPPPNPNRRKPNFNIPVDPPTTPSQPSQFTNFPFHSQNPSRSPVHHIPPQDTHNPPQSRTISHHPVHPPQPPVQLPINQHLNARSQTLPKPPQSPLPYHPYHPQSTAGQSLVINAQTKARPPSIPKPFGLPMHPQMVAQISENEEVYEEFGDSDADSFESNSSEPNIYEDPGELIYANAESYS